MGQFQFGLSHLGLEESLLLFHLEESLLLFQCRLEENPLLFQSRNLLRQLHVPLFDGPKFFLLLFGLLGQLPPLIVGLLQGLGVRLDLVLQQIVLILDGLGFLLVRLNLLLQLPVFRVDGLQTLLL